jgi:hypothetical protein
VLVSYEQWAVSNCFRLSVLGRPWVESFAELSKWVAVATLCVRLAACAHRQLYLQDL